MTTLAVTIIPLCVPDLGGNEARYLQDCINTTLVSSVGPYVGRLEAMVAETTGAAHCVATCSGTAALHVGLVALGVGPGDLVALPSFTFIASANAIAHAGAMPWVMDVEPVGWTLDPALLAHELETACERHDGALVHRTSGRRVAAVLPVHALGLPADMDAIVAVARRFGLPVLADGAAAIGSSSKGRPMGRLGADLSTLSFNGNKTVTAGGGGAVIGDDQALLARARHLSTTARVGRDYDHDMVGYNYRMTNLSAAVGCAQLERLEEMVGAKRRIRAAYDEAFAGLDRLAPFGRPAWAEGSDWFSGVLAADAALASALREALGEAGIEARAFWKPVHRQAPFTAAPRTTQGVVEGLWDRVVILPSSAGLAEADQMRVIDAVLGFIRRRG